MYKLAVLEADRAESVEEIAEIWTLTQTFFDQTFELWQVVRAYDQLSDKLLEHYKKSCRASKRLVKNTEPFSIVRNTSPAVLPPFPHLGTWRARAPRKWITASANQQSMISYMPESGETLDLRLLSLLIWKKNREREATIVEPDLVKGLHSLA
jgi:hypothetical protein